MHPDSAIATRRLDQHTAIAQAEPWQTTLVTPDFPALAVMTDLTKVKAATVNPDTTLRQAEQHMIYKGVRMLLVVTEMPLLEGLITSTDIHGDRAMRVVQQRRLRYDDLRVSDAMTGLAMLDVIDVEQVRIATVSNVIATLKHHGRNHLLVVERVTAQAPQRVVGIISRAQVERQLGRVIDMVEVADGFAEIGQMLA